MPHKDRYFYDAGYTQAIRRVYGETYRGRRLIGRDMDIRGGIVKDGHEVIVIDPDQDPDIYWDYYHEAAKRAKDESGEIVPSRVVGAVFDTVRSNMRYSKKETRRVRLEHKLASSQDIELGVFMRAGFGVCLHQALGCAAMLEDFKESGYLHGHISVDRNERWNPDDEKDKGGHAWVRYTTLRGAPYILDVAQNYFGSLEDSTEVAKWNYLRPEEEFERYVMLQRQLGRTGIKGFMSRMRWLVKGRA
jgi:hypothetical protein